MNAKIIDITIKAAAREAIEQLEATLILNLGTDGLDAALACVNRARSILRHAIESNSKPAPAKTKAVRQTVTRPQAI